MRLRLTEPISLFPACTRGDVVALITLLALVIGFSLPRLRGPIDLRWDGAVYYTLGTSLAEGRGYRLLNEPGEIKAVQYPPLLPALIAAHQLVLKSNDPTIVGQWLRFSFLAIFLVYILAIYALARLYLPLGLALCLALICLFNFEVQFRSDLCFPEIPFSLATVLFVLAHNRRDRFFSIVTGGLGLVAYGLRTVGVCLLASWVVDALLSRNYKKTALRLVILVIAVGSWQSYIRSVEIEPIYNQPAYAYQRADYLFYNVSYARNAFLREPYAKSDRASVLELADRSIRNLAKSPMRFGVALTADRSFLEDQRSAINRRLGSDLVPAWMIDAPLVPLGLLVVVGIGVQLARRQWIIPVYLLFSLLVFSLTPWAEQFTRYFTPLAPFVALSLFLGLDVITGFLRKVWPQRQGRIKVVLVGSLVSLMLLQNGLTLVMMYRRMHQQVEYVDQHGRKITYRLFAYSSRYRSLDAAIDWLRGVSTPDDVIASSMPHWIYLRTGMKAVMPPFETDPVQAQKLLDSVPVSFIVQSGGFPPETREYVIPLVSKFQDRWKLAYSRRGVQIYQRIAPSEKARTISPAVANPTLF